MRLVSFESRWSEVEFECIEGSLTSSVWYYGAVKRGSECSER